MKEIEEILVDYWGGEVLSESDAAVLTEWLSDKRNAEMLRVLEGMRGGKVLREELERDAEAGMVAIRRRCQSERLRVGKRRQWWYGAVAAVAVVAFFVSFVLVRGDFKRGTADRLPVGTTIVSQSVRLELNNGKIVPLRSGQTGGVVVKDSAVCVECGGDTLIYAGGDERAKEEYHTITVSTGAEYSLILADGTKVYLNAESEFRFPTSFSGERREVYLRGEGYFEVAKDSTKKFIVHALNMDATVLGTSFNVKAYPEQDEVVATLEEGSLQVSCEGGQRQCFHMEAGHQVVFHKLTGAAEKKQVETYYYTSWKDGYYCFDGEALDEIMRVLSKWYGLEVFYMNESLKSNKFSGRLRRYGDFLYLLEKFEESCNVEFVVKGKAITVKEKKV